MNRLYMFCWRISDEDNDSHDRVFNGSECSKATASDEASDKYQSLRAAISALGSGFVRL